MNKTKHLFESIRQNVRLIIGLILKQPILWTKFYLHLHNVMCAILCVPCQCFRVRHGQRSFPWCLSADIKTMLSENICMFKMFVIIVECVFFIRLMVALNMDCKQRRTMNQPINSGIMTNFCLDIDEWVVIVRIIGYFIYPMLWNFSPFFCLYLCWLICARSTRTKATIR